MEGMPITYRSIRPEDEEAVFGLRMRTWGSPDIEYVRRNAYSDPLYAKHIFGAFAPDGTLLSTVGYWLRSIRDAGGIPRLVGCVASVVTIEEARRQGHAHILMQMAFDTMRGEGCDWSFLFSSAMGVPLYESLGYCLYPAQYYRGAIHYEDCVTGDSSFPTPNSHYSVDRIEEPFDMTGGSLQAIRRIYASYNAHRPLSLVRDEDYWRGYFASHLVSAHWGGKTCIFLASTDDGPVAYLVTSLLSAQAAGRYFGEGQGFFMREMGSLPGHTTALQALLSATRNYLLSSQSRNAVKEQLPGSAFLPREPPIEEDMRALFGQSLHMSSKDWRTMGLPLGKRFTENDVAAVFQAAGAHFWHIDTF